MYLFTFIWDFRRDYYRACVCDAVRCGERELVWDATFWYGLRARASGSRTRSFVIVYLAACRRVCSFANGLGNITPREHNEIIELWAMAYRIQVLLLQHVFVDVEILPGRVQMCAMKRAEGF